MHIWIFSFDLDIVISSIFWTKDTKAEVGQGRIENPGLKCLF